MVATTSQPSLDRLASLPAEAFVGAIAPWFEGAPGFLWRLAAARPFPTPGSLFERAREIAHSMPEPLQLELIDAHPRLGAPPASVSDMSFREQGYDREAAANLADATTRAREAERERERVAAELDRLNHEYEARFGFRYCVFVAGRSRAELLPDMAAALERKREPELHRALDAVIDIAADRCRTLRAEASAGD
jgi:2-oxo-4-hydroxy-4-carboxy--5-ureidoimidazoline (OHCU) decarboxylase